MGVKLLKGAEIFSEGTWNGDEYGSSVIDSLVSSFDTLNLAGRIPLKLGHEGPDGRMIGEEERRKDPLSQLAFGWVQKVYRQGKKLLADIEVPDKVHQLMLDGFLRYVSVEMLKDVQAGTRVIPWVLDAVALLGSDQPAVGILKDLKALAMTREASSLTHSGVASFSRAADDLKFTTGEKEDMTDSVKEMAEELAALRVKMARQEDQLAVANAAAGLQKATEAKLEAFKAEVRRDKVIAHRKMITDRLEALVKSEDIQPAVRERFCRVNGVEDDDQVLTLTTADVDDYAKANPNPFKKQAPSKIVSLSRATDDVPAGTPVEDEVALRVEAQFRSDGVSDPTSNDWQKATVALFRQNPDLANRYRTAVNVNINHPSARQ